MSPTGFYSTVLRLGSCSASAKRRNF